MRFLDWNTLQFKKDSGKEKLRCPECHETRSDKTDKSLLVNHDEGRGKCFYCESLTFKDKQESNTFDLPPQKQTAYVDIPEAIQKFFKSRKISLKTIDELYIGVEKVYFPQFKAEKEAICFNYYDGSKIVNKKYRGPQKSFTQFQNGKPIFYNINSLVGQKEAWIVEGEMDVLALHEIGIKNVISVPNGANDNDNYWKNSKEHLKNIEKFILAFDCDEKGIELRAKVAHRLGKWKCSYVEFQGKDANEDLISGVLKESVKDIKKFPVTGTHTIETLYDGVLDLYDNGLPKTIKPNGKQFYEVNKIFSVMRGQLVTVTGIPSHGKSSFTEDYVLNLVKDHNFKASFFSPEHTPMSLHQTTFIEKMIGRPFWGSDRLKKSDIERYKQWAKEKLYFTSAEQGKTPNWDWILDKFKEQMFAYGIDIFVIDAFNKVELSGNRLEAINNVLTRLTNFCQQYDVIVFLVAHPTKMKKNENQEYESPTLYDVSGSADFRNQTHNGFSIHRKFGDDGYTIFTNLKTKFKFQGEIGASCMLRYDTETTRYYAYGGMPDKNDYTDTYKPQQIDIMQVDYDSDLPF